ncbi:MAG: hypothetical protein J5J06_11315 [Phycisphaerae bacterium]|nr:hypothetical protein [Phycisphaerae bacterium]
MRVALVQLELEGRSRAANLQRLTRAIDAAAGSESPPDLIVLPGALDTGGGQPSRSILPAAMTAVRETISWKAREWGVYVAAGLHAAIADVWAPCAAVFDPDGDVVAATADLFVGGPVGSTAIPVVRLVPEGNIGVWDLALEADDPPFEGDSAVVAVPLHGHISVGHWRRWESAARALPGVHWALVSAAGSRASTRTVAARTAMYCGADVIAAAADEAEATIMVDIEPAAPPAAGVNGD